MSTTTTSKRLEGLKQPEPRRAEGRDVLCYADQGSFVGLRALGRQPLIHFTWVYLHLLDESEVEQFNERLAQGFFGASAAEISLAVGATSLGGQPCPRPGDMVSGPINGETR